jgi:iron complex outermembrane recepter protein
MKRKYALLSPGLMAVAGTFGAAAPPPVIAQQAPAATATDSGTQLQEVLVTGSRIARDYTATSPIVTVTSDTLERSSSVGIESVLNELPQFQPGATQFDAAQNIQSNAFGGVGAATVDLRGLGTNRTLVLIDGRRAEPADATLVVDVNSIPSAAIQSVEIITGGASAVYGADALAGVVNFILKKNFEGLTVDAQSSITQQGDGAETRLNALYGTNFADGKGNVMFGADWTRRRAVDEADRSFFVDGARDPGTPGVGLNTPAWQPGAASAQASQAALNAVYSGYPAGSASPLANNYFNADGSLFQAGPVLNYKGTDPNVVLRNNGTLSGTADPAYLSSPLERYSTFGRANFNFNEHVSAYLQANFSSTEVASQTMYAPAVTYWGATIPADFVTNPVPAALQTLLQSRANPTAGWALDQNTTFAGPEHSTTTSTVYQVLAGMKGDIPIANWTWDAYASEGRTNTLTALDGGFVSLQNYQDIIQAPNYGAGYTNSNGSSFGYGITCTSGLNPFAIAAGMKVSQDCLNAIEVTMKNYTNFDQEIFEADTQGPLFKLPAGEVRGSVGISYRQDSISFSPDRLLSSNDVSEQQIGLYAVSSTAGQTEVKEAYGELIVPILKDLPALKALDLELGGRYSDYNTAGGQDTWKALLNWTVTDYVSIRGGMQRAARAPNTAELFSGSTLNVVSFAPGDPCAVNTQAPWGNVAANPNRGKVQALCSAIIGTGDSRFDQNPNTYVGPFGFFPLEIETLSGNPALKPEIARTLTGGVVFRSPFTSPAASNITASIDWYHIEIEGLIAPLDAVTVYSLCFNADGSSNPTYSASNPYCKYINRDPVTGDRHLVLAPYSNIGGLKTAGVDLELNWRANLSDMGLARIPGAFSINYLFNYLDTYEEQASPGAPFLQYAGTIGANLSTANGQFRWRSLATFAYDVSSWDFRMVWRHLPSARDGSDVVNPLSTVRGVPTYDIFNFSTSWQITDTVSLRGGIDNLFDKQPVVVGANPPATNNAANTLPDYYDVLGRRFYLGVKLKF